MLLRFSLPFRLRLPLAAFCCAWGLATSAAWGQAEALLIDGEPFDQLVLKKEMVVLKLRPMDLKPRRPVPAAAEGTLKVALYDKPDQMYEVSWAEVESLKLFEELVLEEAAALVKAGKFDEAHAVYQRLERRAADFPGVAEGSAEALFQEGLYWRRESQLDQALSLFAEVHRRNPKRQGLPEQLDQTTDLLVERQLKAGRYEAARRLLSNLAAMSPDSKTAADRTAALAEESAVLSAQAVEARDANDSSKAYDLALAALRIDPAADAAQTLLKDLHGKFPRVRVATFDGDRAFAARRRLLHRCLTEPVAWNAGEATYLSPLGKLTTSDAGLALELAPHACWSRSGAPVSAADVARRLSEAASHGGDPWSAVFQRVETQGPRTLTALLRQPLASPESWLSMPLRPWYSAASLDALTTGPYRLASESPTLRVFQREPNYFALGAAQPFEIVEHRCLDGRAALSQLAAGEVDALDQIDPLHTAAARRLPNVVVEPYASPTYHWLLPNPQGRRTRDRVFRQALHNGLSPESILHGLAGANLEADSARALSTLFTFGDPSPPRPKMMSVLALAVEGDASDDAPAPLVLGFAESEFNRRLCQAAADQWKLDGRGVNVV